MFLSLGNCHCNGVSAAAESFRQRGAEDRSPQVVLSLRALAPDQGVALADRALLHRLTIFVCAFFYGVRSMQASIDTGQVLLDVHQFEVSSHCF